MDLLSVKEWLHLEICYRENIALNRSHWALTRRRSGLKVIVFVNVVAEDDLVGVWDDVGCDCADHEGDGGEQHCNRRLNFKGV
jgi:hypothetical protein